ncbi:hypothetical protein GCM10009111_16010 [Colwellia asteriadis]|uniref:Uncharacterized protein n=1 Tax=Colwellia asteriadis TaxID=517723 RepID=A0ABN1L6E6_9GAMM
MPSSLIFTTQPDSENNKGVAANNTSTVFFMVIPFIVVIVSTLSVKAKKLPKNKPLILRDLLKKLQRGM